MVNSIPSPMATSSWLNSLAFFLSLYASNSPSARSRSPSRSIPSAQSYKISNTPLSGNSCRKTKRAEIIQSAVKIKIFSPYIYTRSSHIHHVTYIVFRRDFQRFGRNRANMITSFACIRVRCYLRSVASTYRRQKWCVDAFNRNRRRFMRDTCCTGMFDTHSRCKKFSTTYYREYTDKVVSIFIATYDI